MSYDNTNSGVAFQASGFNGRLNIKGIEYRLFGVGADDRAKFKYQFCFNNKEECYSFVLFKNDKKSDKSPDYGCKIELNNGEVYYINAWHKKSEKGQYYLSFSVKDANNNEVGNGVVGDNTSYASDEDSCIQF